VLGELADSNGNQTILKEVRRCSADIDVLCAVAIKAAKSTNDLALPREATRSLSDFLSHNRKTFENEDEVKNPKFPLYGDIWILIAFRWTDSEQLFGALFTDNKYIGVRKQIIAKLAKEVAGPWEKGSGQVRVEEDPFIAYHRPIYRQLMSPGTEVSLRADASLLYFSTTRDVDEVEEAVVRDIEDGDERIAAIAAQAAANFAIMPLGPLMEQKCIGSKGSSNSAYCRAARSLGRQIQ
jgi:hypothetical protein